MKLIDKKSLGLMINFFVFISNVYGLTNDSIMNNDKYFTDISNITVNYKKINIERLQNLTDGNNEVGKEKPRRKQRFFFANR